MKKNLSTLIVCALALLILGGSPDADARKKTTKRKATTGKTTTSSEFSQTVELFYQYNMYGRHEVTLTLSPSGTAHEVTYTTYDSFDGKKLTGDNYGTWTKLYMLIGDGNRRYYYNINVNGSMFYYIKGWNRLYYNFADFRNFANKGYYKVTETVK